LVAPEIATSLLSWNLPVEMISTWTWISGENLPYKEELAAMGFIFEDSMKSWYLGPAACCVVNRDPLSDSDLMASHLQKTLDALLH
jgi:hypothetical protein